MITVAGVPVLRPTRGFVELVARHCDPKEFVPWAERAWPGFGMAGLTLPTGFVVPREVRLNRLRWPRGASRWASMFLAVSAAQLNEIAKAAWGNDGKSQNPVVLHLDSPGGPDATNEVFEAAMYALPARQLFHRTPKDGPPPPPEEVDPSEPPETNNPWLLTLVDERYYWPDINVGNLRVDDDSGMGWEALVHTVATQLQAFAGFSFTHSDIPAAYLSAAPFFTLPYEPAPFVLDACAYNLGMRVVRDRTGAVRMDDFDDANGRSDDDFNAHTKRKIIAGGDSFIDGLFF